MASLNHTLEDPASFPLPSSALRPNLVCCAKYPFDERWHRALVIGPEVSEAGSNGVKNTGVSYNVCLHFMYGLSNLKMVSPCTRFFIPFLVHM